MNKLIITLILVITNIMTVFSQNYNFEYKQQITLDSTETHKDWIDRIELFISSKFSTPKEVTIYKNGERGIYKLTGVIVKDNIPTGYPQTITTKWSFDMLIMKRDGVIVMKIYNIENYKRYTINNYKINITPPSYLSWTRYEESVPSPFKMNSKRQKVLREVFSIHREFQSLEQNFKYYMEEDFDKILGYLIER